MGQVLKKYRLVWVGLLLAAIVAFPYIKTGYVIRLCTTVFLYVALAQAWNTLSGFSGYVSLGITGFVGLGAYATGVLMTRYALPFTAALVGAVLVAGLVALLISVPILRLRSGYFSISTLAISFIMRELINNWTNITGGGMGLTLPFIDGEIDDINAFFYFVMFAIAVFASLVNYQISRSRLGYGLWAIKEDEEAAGMLGVNTTVYKVIAFVISSSMAGLIGGAYAYWLTFIDPLTVFDSAMSILVIVMTMLGSAGTWLGPIMGGVVVSIISEYLWNNFLAWHTGILGLILMLTVIFVPKGFTEIIHNGRRGWRYMLSELWKNTQRYRA